MKTSDAFILGGRMENVQLFQREVVRRNVSDGLVRCKGKNSVSSEIF